MTIEFKQESAGKVVWSLFSGAMGLDLGLVRAGLEPAVAVEIDAACAATAKANPWLPTMFLAEDIRSLTAHDIRTRSNSVGDVFLIVGGPPCQAFSPGGNREGLSDPRGNLIYEYFRVIRDARPAYFVFENVANLATAALKHRQIADRPGKHWNLKSYERDRGHGVDDDVAPMQDDELSGSAVRSLLAEIETLGYRICFGVVDAADYGAPQHRLRFVMIGAREGLPPRLPPATHGLPGSGLLPFATLRDAIWDIRDDPGRFYNYTPKFAELFRQVPAGGYWRHLPAHLHKEALGNAFESGGGKTGFFRRLAWDAPAPTVTGKPNRKGAAMCHPDQTRSLGVRECSRIQGFPDDWVFAGTTEAQFRQIGNAVPVHLGHAIGRAILTGERASPDELDIEAMLTAAIARLRSAGRNKVKARVVQPSDKSIQMPLFG